MFREVARCPYCGRVTAAVDDDAAGLVMAPDRADGRPCGHLAFLSAGLEAFRPDGGRDAGRSAVWLWVRGEGLRRLDRLDDLGEYVDLVALGMLAGDALPAAEYRVAGATAGERQAARAGAGEFPVGGSGGRTVVAVLDGHALYSMTPDTLVAGVRRLAEAD